MPQFSSEPKFPNATQPFSLLMKDSVTIIEQVCYALRRAGASDDDIDSFKSETRDLPYIQLVTTVSEWITLAG